MEEESERERVGDRWREKSWEPKGDLNSVFRLQRLLLVRLKSFKLLSVDHYRGGTEISPIRGPERPRLLLAFGSSN